MELAGAGNDVLAGLLDAAEHQGIGLGEALEALNELGEIGRDLRCWGGIALKGWITGADARQDEGWGWGYGRQSCKPCRVS